jgi:hypothetical protein
MRGSETRGVWLHPDGSTDDIRSGIDTPWYRRAKAIFGGFGNLRAHWYVYPPDGPRTDERTTLVTANDVDDLLVALGAPHVDDAYLTTDELNAFVIHLALHDGWGYLAWSDDSFLGSPVGDPASPGTHGTFNTDYFPGTGLPPAVLGQVLKAVLTTGSRPTTVEWISDDELEAATTESR